jgi:tetratricopeptide (TPR) repeat protein
VEAIKASLAPGFVGGSLKPALSRAVRSDGILEIHLNEFAPMATANGNDFLADWASTLQPYSRVLAAQFQIVAIAQNSGLSPPRIDTRIRYEMVATGQGFYREQRTGHWKIEWELQANGDYLARRWVATQETRSRTTSKCFVDISRQALGGNACLEAQLNHGADYWRTVLDGASAIDIYGHNGVSVDDIDGDGFDDLYVCQAAGLPNRLFRNRGDGTLEDITEQSGLGILEATSCALIVDINNDGRQEVIVVCASGPKLFLNLGNGKFREQQNAFQFAHPPQGTFTGAAVADYDRDGWLDIYFCLYTFYQGSEQYKYPLPYYDAENGPPNFFFRNNRDGTFKDVTEQAGLNAGNTRYSFCCGWSDFNGDGWPDLYVVNDFGRKNLYRNNGDGTFTDVAAIAGVEDTGAGMSVCWLDYNNDGREDVYVANMWTAAGMRIAAMPQFQASTTSEVRSRYLKHAMGNSLFRNAGSGAFTNQTNTSGTSVGRWSWSSDAWDFDHDGNADLYVTNGMVSGPSRDDLNSFFWRQVVAKSPLDTKPTLAYEQGWTAINELIRGDATWSGYDRNVFYANHGDGTFSDVAGAIGLDFLEDGRSFAVADFDHDGRQEVFLKNRNAPQLRLLKNVIPSLPPSIAFRLEGTKSNRDAIGAVVTVITDQGSQVRSLQAGSGFLAQHSKELFFGLSKAKGAVRASIRWPSGIVQELHDLQPNHRVWVKEGEPPAHIEPFADLKLPTGDPEIAFLPEVIPSTIATWLLDPVAAPDFAISDYRGKDYKLSDFRGKPLLLNFWTTDAPDWQQNLISLNRASAAGGILCVTVNFSDDAKVASQWIAAKKLEIPILRGNPDVSAVYNLLFRYIFDRHRDLPLPSTFLINAKLEIEKIYQGPLDRELIQLDVHALSAPVAERTARALPFRGVLGDVEFRRNYLSFGSVFFQRGYFEQSQAAFTRALQDDPSSAEALYGVGSACLQLNKLDEAQGMFERATKARAEYPATLPNAWNNLGLISTKQGRMNDAIADFQRALAISPDHLVALQNLGNAYRTTGNWPEAQQVLEHAVQVAPQDAESNYALAMTYAPQGDTDRAYQYLQRALKIRPDYPEALNNLGVLLLRTQRVDEAISTFQQCIRVAPDFPQGYINLAKVYAVQQKPEQARSVLQQLLAHRPEDPTAKQMLDQLAH